MAEVKRAYRHLAKTFHPDSAGEKALPRFLAIHEAYERLTTGRVRGAARPSPAGGPAGEPWRADPDRARAARERARRRTGQPGGTGKTGTAGPSFDAGRKRPTGSTGSAASSGPGSREKARRNVRKATLGSTSYDEARETTDATWGGASWYGPSSGEYWIVNPREYADPRKHGPTYQQRARKPAAAGGTTMDGDRDGATADAIGVDSEPRAAGRPAGADSPRDARQWSAPGRPAWAAADRDPSAAGDARGDARPGDAAFDPFGLAAAGRDWLGGPADDPIRRLGLALVAWPPIGLAAAAAIGEITGCASYAAACGASDTLVPWLAQAAILGLLLLLPPLARWFVGGTVAVLLALVPVTALLLVIGAGGAPQAGFVLSVFLALAWLCGVGWAALGGRWRGRPDGGDESGYET